jgi:hypothetical protein
MGPKTGADGKLAITFPMGNEKLAGIAAEDIGKCAYGIFKNGNEYINKTVGIAGGLLTISQMAEVFSKAFGKEMKYNEITPEVYRGFGFPGAEDLGNMFQFYRDFSDVFVNSRNPELSKRLNPSLQTFESWVNDNKSRIPIE